MGLGVLSAMPDGPGTGERNREGYPELVLTTALTLEQVGAGEDKWRQTRL